MGEPLNEEDGLIIKEEVEIFAPYCQIIIHLKGLCMRAWCKTDVAQHNLLWPYYLESFISHFANSEQYWFM